MSSAAVSNVHNLDSLRNLVIAIGRGQANVSLGTKAHAVLAKLVDRPGDVAVSTISELASSMGVHASTLTRLATRLGFAGFGEFQAVFREHLTQDGPHFYTRQAGRLLDGTTIHEPLSCCDLVTQLAQESVRNVVGFLQQLDESELQQTARLLAHAPRVRIYGIRQIHSLVSFLNYGLNLLRAEVSLLSGPGQGVAESLAQMTHGDVLVVSSLAPYSRIVAEVAHAAARSGIHVVAITDTRASPLAAAARHAFFIPYESSFISNSMGACMIFCEGLINLVARELGEKGLKALERREGFINALHIETP
ncbi:MurR/RpiR family transcriptional regulator [Comamonas composti]|uniref:MurR/RpiR family transcriptional regulator n=1 Tax=Comamonas composti TaxID=408558 RepID=UPI0004177DB5|nr:MurR/RpiR family transcriptional regulator [Comamonas composti]